jgi:hypothetical protein
MFIDIEEACVITHGGMGATQKALARGVPVCAVPFGRDQLEVARRVEVAGAGTRLVAKKLRADRLRAATLRAMDLREGAERIAQAYRDAGGANAAADHFEGILTHTASTVTPTSVMRSRRSTLIVRDSTAGDPRASMHRCKECPTPCPREEPNERGAFLGRRVSN